MALSELIKYEGDNSTFIWKYPNEDFNNMTELVVNESQEAIFFANGRAADTFGPGRYRLDAKNIPILTGMLNIVTGVSIFHCQVYYINKTVQMAMKWGTDSKVRFVEPTLGIPVELGASGDMNLAVSDGRKLLFRLVGTTAGIAWGDGPGFAKSLQASFRPLISTQVKTYLASSIKARNIDIVEIDQHLAELSEELRMRVAPGFEEYGLTTPQFYLTTVVLPDNDPNFKRLKDLHTITLQKRMATAEAEVRTVQAESRAAYMTAEAAAEAEIKAAQRGAILEEQTTETEIKRREAERKLIEAQAEAQAAQMAGMAEAAVMQAKGYNQKDVLQAEVQKAYAEGIGNMGPAVSAGGGSSIVGDMLGLGVGMAAMNAMAPQVGNIFQNMNPQQAASGFVPAQEGVRDGPGSAMPEPTWDCPACGAKNIRSKFCPECGAKKPEPKPGDSWDCPECGVKNITSKFCPDCGAKRPESSKGWTCPECGKKDITSKFCPECGYRRAD